MALPPGFNPAAYLSANPDVAAAGMDPSQHYLLHGMNEGRALGVGNPMSPGVMPVGRLEPFNQVQRSALESIAAGPAPSPYQAYAERMMGNVEDFLPQIGAQFGAQRYNQLYDTFRNPYARDVLDASMADINRAADIERSRIGGMATQSGQFGGARQGVLESELGRNVLDTVGRTSANLNYEGHNLASRSALDVINQDRGAAFNAAQMGLAGFGAASNAGQQDFNNFFARQNAALGAGDRIQGQNQSMLDLIQQERMNIFGFPFQQADTLGMGLARFPTGGTMAPPSYQEPDALSRLGQFGLAGEAIIDAFGNKPQSLK